MFIQILHLSQWCWKHNHKQIGRLLDSVNRLACTADVSGKTKIAKSVAFPHGALGVVVNSQSVIGEGCVINAKVTLASEFPHDGAPKIGKHVWIGAGAFIGGMVEIPDNVIIGANSVLTKSIAESGVVVAGIPAKVLRKLTPEEIEKLMWDKK